MTGPAGPPTQGAPTTPATPAGHPATTSPPPPAADRPRPGTDGPGPPIPVPAEPGPAQPRDGPPHPEDRSLLCRPAVPDRPHPVQGPRRAQAVPAASAAGPAARPPGGSTEA